MCLCVREKKSGGVVNSLKTEDIYLCRCQWHDSRVFIVSTLANSSCMSESSLRFKRVCGGGGDGVVVVMPPGARVDMHTCNGA